MTFLLLALLACAPGGHGAAQHDAVQHDAAQHEAHTDPTQHDAASHDAHAATAAPAAPGALALVLDEGEKWQMDAHTRQAMGQLRAALSSTELATAADAQALAATLQGHLDALVQGCTMTGAAHDQLHVFLVAFMPAVKALGNAPDPATARQQQDQLVAMVAQYDQHFE